MTAFDPVVFDLIAFDAGAPFVIAPIPPKVTITAAAIPGAEEITPSGRPAKVTITASSTGAALSVVDASQPAELIWN